MAKLIKSVPADSFQSCDVFNTVTNGFNANTSVGPIKVGASGGVTESFWGDINDYWYQSGGHPEGVAKWSGTNGSDHWSVREFGNDYSRYLDGNMVDAIQFKENNDSTAGNGLYIFRYAIGISNGSSKEWYDLSGKMNRPGTYGRTHTAYFNSTLMNRLKSGWYVRGLLVEVSCAPKRAGSHATNTTISNLKFRAVGARGKNLILPVKRWNYDASKTNWIGK